jgi:hypothetical protein
MNVEQDPNLSPETPKAATDHPAAASRYQQRRERGRVARRVVPRIMHGEWAPAPDRPDPIDLLKAQARDRIQELIPIRYSRMMASRSPSCAGQPSLWPATSLAPRRPASRLSFAATPTS